MFGVENVKFWGIEKVSYSNIIEWSMVQDDFSAMKTHLMEDSIKFQEVNESKMETTAYRKKEPHKLIPFHG